jgi:hypothetical protein
MGREPLSATERSQACPRDPRRLQCAYGSHGSPPSLADAGWRVTTSGWSA